MPVRIPNFFIVGAARSGTTAVARYLAEHPQVYMSPIKEPSYFARGIIPELQPLNWERNQRGLDRYLDGPMFERRGGCVLDWEGYLRLFRNAAGERALGEASTAYLISPEAPAEIFSAAPQARIIILLRDPIARVVSTYRMLRDGGSLRMPFSGVIRGDAGGPLSQWRRLILDTRRIAPGVERFLRTFPERQVRWYFHDELVRAPLSLVQRIYTFLGVDPGFRPDVSRRYNESMRPRLPLLHRAVHSTGLWKAASRFVPHSGKSALRGLFFSHDRGPDVSAEDREILRDYFSDDVARLERLLEADLSHWLKSDRARWPEPL
jgi:hypothetical protein